MPLNLCALAALLLPLSAFAGDKREAVLELLNGIEDTPTAADLAVLGEGVEAELMEIADDKHVPSTRRGRAVSALQHYKTEAVVTYLEDHLEGTDALLRRKAAWSLAAWGGAAVPKLTAALDADDVQLRIAAAGALGSIADDAARSALSARLEREPEAAVKEAITKSLGEAK